MWLRLAVGLPGKQAVVCRTAIPWTRRRRKSSYMLSDSPTLGPFPALGFLIARCFLVTEAPASQGHNLFVKPAAQCSQWGGGFGHCEKMLVFICGMLWLNGCKQGPVPVAGTPGLYCSSRCTLPRPSGDLASIRHSSVSPSLTVALYFS